VKMETIDFFMLFIFGEVKEFLFDFNVSTMFNRSDTSFR